MTAKSAVRVRIAPSPTGYFHIGTARTALFNWLFARHEGGAFIVRIEDTDKERSEARYEKDIFESLAWLGLDADEGSEEGGPYAPYRQSERIPHYTRYVEQLLRDRHAYYCFCTKEALEAERQSQLASGIAPKYSGKCREIAFEEAERRRAQGESSVIRFASPGKSVAFHDLIRGKISFDTSLIGDFVIAKDTRTPLYNFAVVVDDYEMKISHVIRGEDHIPNTPKQLMMQEALGFPSPHYGHVPLILDPDRSKMSKRYSATAVREYRAAGYLPDAMANFIALLGWHPVQEKEVLSRKELIEHFSLERVQKAGAVFNEEKLHWLNKQYIRALRGADLVSRMREIEVAFPAHASDVALEKATELVRDRMSTLREWEALTDFFWSLPEYDAAALIWKSTPPSAVGDILRDLHARIGGIPQDDFSEVRLAAACDPLIAAHGKGAVLWPLRYAVSGKAASPGPFEIMVVLGKKETLARLSIAVKKFENAYGGTGVASGT